MSAPLSDRLHAVTAQLVARYGAPSAVPPVTSPPPPPSTAGRLSGLQLLGDDFTRYADTAALRAQMSSIIGGTGDYHTCLYNDGRGATQVTLDTAVQYQGHPSMRYDFPVGGGPPEMYVWFKTPLDVMWYRTRVRFAPGFTTVGTNTNAANAYKFLAWMWPPGINGRGDFSITNTSEYELSFNVLVNGAAVVAAPWPSGGNITTEWTDGGWYDTILEFNRTSPTTAIARAWRARDGSPPVLVATASATAPAGQTIPQAGGVALGMNFNQNIINPMSLNYGAWEVVDGTAHPDPFRVNGGVN